MTSVAFLVLFLLTDECCDLSWQVSTDVFADLFDVPFC